MTVVFLHGAFGMATDWDDVRQALMARLSVSDDVTVPAVLAFNIAGHGEVVADPKSDDTDALFEEAADNIAVALEGIKGAVTLVGYSLGARVALAALLLHPERTAHVERLVLVSGTAGLEDEGDRDERRAIDDDRAAAFAQDPAAFLASFWTLPLFADLQGHPGVTTLLLKRQERAVLDTALRARWMRGLSVARMPSLWPLLNSLRIDVDLVVGGNDATYVKAAHRIQQLVPKAKLHTIDGVGHAVPVLAPEAIVEIIAPSRPEP